MWACIKSKDKKKVAKALKTLMNQPNTGNVLVTGTNLTQPGPTVKAKDKFFLKVSGKGKLVIDSECFTFAPALKGIPKKAVDATQQGFQLTMQLYAGRVAALEKKIAVLEKQLKVGDGGGCGSITNTVMPIA
jgi:hypothetical protein